MLQRLALTVIALLGACVMPGAANAVAPAYAGTWGSDAKQCKVSQDQQGAPLVIGAKGYDQHETHCAFDKIKRSGGAWKVQAKCSVEGDKQKDTFNMKVSGDALEIARGGHVQKLTRCK